MSISTGYFSYTKKYNEMGYLPISIARVTPKWFNGAICKDLAPSYDLLSRYKCATVSEEDYKFEYYKMLDLITDEVFDKLLLKFDSVNAVLLCYEKSEVFCHRHLLAKYVKNRFNIIITEVELIK